MPGQPVVERCVHAAFPQHLTPSVLVLLISIGAMTLGLVAAKRQLDSGNDVNALVCIAFGSLLVSPISRTHHWVWAVLALMVLVQGRHHVVAAVLAAVFVIAPMWLAPRGHFLELKDNWWQAAACVAYLVVALTYLPSSRRAVSLHKEAAQPPGSHRPYR